MTFYATVNGVDIADRLLQLDIEASGLFTVGGATMKFRKTSGGLDVRNKYPVEVYEDDGAGNVTWAWFGGFISNDKATNEYLSKYNELTCQDQNILLDQLGCGAAIADRVVIESNPLTTQLTDVINSTQNQGGAPTTTINSTTFVENISGATNLAFHEFRGNSLRHMLTVIGQDVQSRVTTSRPRHNIAPSRAFPRATFGGPHLYFFDAAVATSPLYHFSDAPTGAQRHLYGFERNLEGTHLVNRRQLIYAPTGEVYTGVDTASKALYPNGFIGHGYWWESPTKVDEYIDPAIRATLLQSQIDRSIAQTGYPRETITFQVDDDIRVIPGDVVTLTHSLYGIAAVNYRVAKESLRWNEETGQVEIWLVLNARKLQWFEEGEEGVDMPPVEIDIIAPDPPTSLTVPFNIWDWGQGVPVRRITFTPSTSADVAGYQIVDTVAGETYIQDIGLSTTYDIARGPGGASYSTYVRAYDSSPRRNFSGPSNVVTGTTASHLVWEQIPNPSFEELGQSDAAQDPPAYWSEIAASGGGSSGTSTTQHLGGDRALVLTATGTGSIVKRRSQIAGTEPSTNHRVRIPNYGSASVNALYVEVEWMQGGSLASSNVLANDVAVSATWAYTEYNITSPALIDGRRIILGIVTPSGAVTLYIDDVIFEPTIQGPGIKDGAITTDKIADLAITTAKIDDEAVDGDKLALVINYTGIFTSNIGSEANALTGRITDIATFTAPGALKLQHRASAGAPGIGFGIAQIFEADSDTTQDRRQGTIRTRWLDPADATRQATLALMSNTTGSNTLVERFRVTDKECISSKAMVVGTAALATTATEGFLYIPSCAGTPTGTPTAYTGTLPLVYDSTNSILYIYVGGAWVAV